MNPYLWMTLGATAAKLWALTQLKQNWHDSIASRLVLALICVLLVQSICELSLYRFAENWQTQAAYWSIIGYYLCTFTVIALLPFIASALAERRFDFHFSVIAIAIFSATVYMLVATDLIIAGVHPLNYSLTRIPGSYYWIFQTAALLSVLFVVITLFATRRSRDIFIRTKSNNILLAFVPAGLFSIIVVFAMSFGIHINAVGILPICFAIFGIALVDNINPSKIPDYMCLVPFSRKAKLMRRLTRHVRIVNRQGLEQEAKREYQELMMSYALEMFNGNQTRAAQWLKVSQSWVSRSCSSKAES